MFLRLRGLVNWFRSDVWFSLWVLPCFIFNNSSNSIGDVFIKKNVSRIFRFYWVIFILYTIFFFFDSIFRIGLAGVLLPFIYMVASTLLALGVRYLVYRHMLVD